MKKIALEAIMSTATKLQIESIGNIHFEIPSERAILLKNTYYMPMSTVTTISSSGVLCTMISLNKPLLPETGQLSTSVSDPLCASGSPLLNCNVKPIPNCFQCTSIKINTLPSPKAAVRKTFLVTTALAKSSPSKQSEVKPLVAVEIFGEPFQTLGHNALSEV
ncbi:hypothetical protein CHUAL_011320 [Chamberlinius hualienensis]